MQFLQILATSFDDSYRDISNVLSVTRWIFEVNIFRVLSLCFAFLHVRKTEVRTPKKWYVVALIRGVG